MEQINYKINNFEGPMDLLLYLIQKHKININDIPIVELVDQYLDYVKDMQNADFEVAGDFLEMAARLVYIKTVSLLPRKEEAEKLKQELTGELIEYRDCKIAAEELSHHTQGFNMYSRKPAEKVINYEYSRLHEPSEIAEAYSDAIGRRMRRLPPPIDSFKKIVARKFTSVKTRLDSVLQKLKKNSRLKFHSLFSDAHSKSDLVATFLAVLEMAKNKQIKISGSISDPQLKLREDGLPDDE